VGQGGLPVVRPFCYRNKTAMEKGSPISVSDFNFAAFRLNPFADGQAGCKGCFGFRFFLSGFGLAAVSVTSVSTAGGW
jgi:hypothetical protein